MLVNWKSLNFEKVCQLNNDSSTFTFSSVHEPEKLFPWMRVDDAILCPTRWIYWACKLGLVNTSKDVRIKCQSCSSNLMLKICLQIHLEEFVLVLALPYLLYLARKSKLLSEFFLIALPRQNSLLALAKKTKFSFLLDDSVHRLLFLDCSVCF